MCLGTGRLEPYDSRTWNRIELETALGLRAQSSEQLAADLFPLCNYETVSQGHVDTAIGRRRRLGGRIRKIFCLVPHQEDKLSVSRYFK